MRVRYRRIPLREDEVANRNQFLVKPPSAAPFETRYTKNANERIETVSRYGPFSKTISRPYPQATSLRSFYDRKEWWRAKTKRKTYPLPYTHVSGRVLSLKGTNYYQDAVSSGAGYLAETGNGTWDALAQNAARSRFVSQVRDKSAANLAVTLVEWEQSNKMIAYRAGQLMNFVQRMKKGDVNGAVQALGDRTRRLAKEKRKKQLPGRASDGSVGRGMDRELLSERERREMTRKIRSGSKSVSSAILELQYGWVPLVDDINKACMVLASNPPAHKVVGRGTYRRPYSGGSLTVGSWHSQGVYTARCHIQATVYVSNANLALANQLGFVNPIATAWNVIPFSFLVDRYLLPVGNFLNSFSDLLGYKLEYAFTTTTRYVRDLQRYMNSPTSIDVGDSEGWYQSRAGGIPPYALKTQPFEGFKPVEGAVAIALLIQQCLSIK